MDFSSLSEWLKKYVVYKEDFYLDEKSVRVYETDSEVKSEDDAQNGRDITSYLLWAPIKLEEEERVIVRVPEKPERKINPRKVFIVHGRDDKPMLELARMLEKETRLEPIVLREKPDEGRTIVEKLEKYSDVGYAIVILTPDDVGALEKEKSNLKLRARQNVVLELGYFMGLLGRSRVCCLLKGDVERPSDMGGVIYKRFEISVKECFLDIVKELKAAGYEIKM